jgi:BirA family transcriptional regulator, biotin operon repressor / biotin---[acetyl-CoA-carboxylase] ligase
LIQLDPTAVAAGARLIVHDTIASTNADGLVRARAGERGPLWIVARQQSAGRGRRGRVWVSEPGNLYASLVLAEPAPPERFPQLSFVAALAVHDAVSRSNPGISARLTLKWPNDLLIDGEKFAGILIEGEGTAVAIGIGVNCFHHPSGTAFPATDLAAAGMRATPESVFAPLSAAMTSRLGQWNRGAGFEAIRADWLARGAWIGRPIRVTLADGELAGDFEAVDEGGRLVLRLADGVSRTIAAGDVSMARQ